MSQAQKEKEIPKYQQTLDDIVASYATGDYPVKIDLIRDFPTEWQGHPIKGSIATFEEAITEEDVRKTYGGGKYQIRIRMPNEQGKYTYKNSLKFEIAGDPKITPMTGENNGSYAAANAPVVEPASVVTRAMDMTHRLLEKSEARADRISQEAHKPDPTVGMLMDEIRAMRDQLNDKDRRLLDVMQRPSAPSTSDTLVHKLFDNEHSRIDSLRAQFDSELRMRTEMHAKEVDRLNQRTDDLLRRQEDAHKREVDGLQRSFDSQLATLKLAYEGQIQALHHQLTTLDREVTLSKTEVVELRAKKDKGLVETMTELASVREAMDVFGGNKEPNESTMERVISGVLNSSLAEGVATRLAGPAMAAQPQPPQEQQELPINRPVRMPNGKIVVRREDGSVIELRKKSAQPAPTGDEPVFVSDEDIKAAISFLESALTADADPAQFARTARNLMPSLTQGSVRKMLEVQGVDEFFKRVAKLNPTSTLLMQHGKNWVRKVAAALLE